MLARTRCGHADSNKLPAARMECTHRCDRKYGRWLHKMLMVS